MLLANARIHRAVFVPLETNLAQIHLILSRFLAKFEQKRRSSAKKALRPEQRQGIIREGPHQGKAGFRRDLPRRLLSVQAWQW